MPEICEKAEKLIDKMTCKKEEKEEIKIEEPEKPVEIVEEKQEEKDRRRTIVYELNDKRPLYNKFYIFTQEDLDNDDIISMVDTTPTHSRKKNMLESIKAKSSNHESSHPAPEQQENATPNMIKF